MYIDLLNFCLGTVDPARVSQSLAGAPLLLKLLATCRSNGDKFPEDKGFPLSLTVQSGSWISQCFFPFIERPVPKSHLLHSFSAKAYNAPIFTLTPSSLRDATFKQMEYFGILPKMVKCLKSL
jgi:hypothetical protein